MRAAQQQLALWQQQARAAEKALNMPTPPAATPVAEDGPKPVLPIATGAGLSGLRAWCSPCIFLGCPSCGGSVLAASAVAT